MQQSSAADPSPVSPRKPGTPGPTLCLLGPQRSPGRPAVRGQAGVAPCVAGAGREAVDLAVDTTSATGITNNISVVSLK